MSDWKSLLAQAVEASQRGIAGVADELGLSRTAVSLVLADKYPARTDRIEAKVLDTYARLVCPHLGDTITLSACRRHALRATPTNSPREMRHWRACQGCPSKPKGDDHAC